MKGTSTPESALLEQVISIIAEHPLPVYLVGGVVRDLFLERDYHDIDLAVEAEAISLTFKLADRLHLPAYIMDKSRDVGRIVVPDTKMTIDVARFRGPDLLTDLYHRDFTFNAMALPVSSRSLDAIIDPFSGRNHINARQLHIIHPRSIEEDPVRALRLARLAVQLDFQITADSWVAASAVGPSIPTRVSSERIRDELTRLLVNLSRPQESVHLLSQLGILNEVLPEVTALIGIAQSSPHHEPAYEHTLRTLNYLVDVEQWLAGDLSSDKSQWEEGAEQALGRYRSDWLNLLQMEIDGGHTAGQLLRWAALLHDTGKAQTQTIEADGRIRFLGHDEVGAKLARHRCNILSFSNQATRFIGEVVAGHMRPFFLANEGRQPSRRSIYRFFRDYPAAGLPIPVLAIADHLATYDGPGPTLNWERLLAVVQILLETYFTAYQETVAPVLLLKGEEIINLLQIAPGPEVGRLVRLMEEAQAAGELTNRQQAIDFLRTHHKKQKNRQLPAKRSNRL